jgi:hypothetical protein
LSGRFYFKNPQKRTVLRQLGWSPDNCLLYPGYCTRYLTVAAFYNDVIPTMKTHRNFKAIFVIVTFTCINLLQVPSGAAKTDGLPNFADFITTVVDGNSSAVRGVYVPGVLAFPVLQQPANDAGAVSKQDDEVTQFSAAAANNVIGLLAHNTLAGTHFSELKLGGEIRIVYGDGRVEFFLVNQISRFKALEPLSVFTNFVDVKSNLNYSTAEIFNMFYKGGYHVTFQTCIYKNGDASWGRLFITAFPAPVNYLREIRTSAFMRVDDPLYMGNLFHLEDTVK